MELSLDNIDLDQSDRAALEAQFESQEQRQFEEATADLYGTNNDYHESQSIFTDQELEQIEKKVQPEKTKNQSKLNETFKFVEEQKKIDLRSKTNQIDWDKVDFVKGDYTHLLPTEDMKEAIKDWNKMTYEQQEDVLHHVTIPDFTPVPVLTYYQIPILHHYPLNQIMRKIEPYPVEFPYYNKINREIDVDIPVEQKIVIPQMVPYGVHVPVPVPYPAKGKPNPALGPYLSRVQKEQEEHEYFEKEKPKNPIDGQRITIIGDIDNQISKSQVHVPTIDPPRFKQDKKFLELQDIDQQTLIKMYDNDEIEN